MFLNFIYPGNSSYNDDKNIAVKVNILSEQASWPVRTTFLKLVIELFYTQQKQTRLNTCHDGCIE